MKRLLKKISKNIPPQFKFINADTEITSMSGHRALLDDDGNVIAWGFNDDGDENYLYCYHGEAANMLGIESGAQLYVHKGKLIEIEYPRGAFKAYLELTKNMEEFPPDWRKQMDEIEKGLMEKDIQFLQSKFPGWRIVNIKT